MLVVGDSGVGKTSLMNFLCGEVACSASATVGCTTHVKVCCQQCETWRSVPVSQVDLVLVCLCLFTGVHMRARVGQLLERGRAATARVGERGARRRLAASRILCAVAGACVPLAARAPGTCRRILGCGWPARVRTRPLYVLQGRKRCVRVVRNRTSMSRACFGARSHTVCVAPQGSCLCMMCQTGSPTTMCEDG